MAAHQHLKTNTHTHPAATNSEAVCLLHKGAAARTPPDSSTRTVITFFRYFHFFDLLLFFGLFLVLNFFFTNPDSAGKMVLLFPSEGSSDFTIEIFTGAYRTAHQPLYTHRL